MRAALQHPAHPHPAPHRLGEGNMTFGGGSSRVLDRLAANANSNDTTLFARTLTRWVSTHRQ